MSDLHDRIEDTRRRIGATLLEVQNLTGRLATELHALANAYVDHCDAIRSSSQWRADVLGDTA